MYLLQLYCIINAEIYIQFLQKQNLKKQWHSGRELINKPVKEGDAILT